MNKNLPDKLTRCPRLGQEIKFSYCLQESGDLPCARIIACWSPVCAVAELMKEKLAPEVWQKFVNRKPQEKVLSLIEMIEAAKARNE